MPAFVVGKGENNLRLPVGCGLLVAKVTMFAVEMWFGAKDGVECGRSTGLCPLPLGVPRCVIHNKKNVGTKFLVILKKNKY